MWIISPAQVLGGGSLELVDEVPQPSRGGRSPLPGRTPAAQSITVQRAQAAAAEALMASRAAQLSAAAEASEIGAARVQARLLEALQSRTDLQVSCTPIVCCVIL